MSMGIKAYITYVYVAVERADETWGCFFILHVFNIVTVGRQMNISKHIKLCMLQWSETE
jgi:hypothetical protein